MIGIELQEKIELFLSQVARVDLKGSESALLDAERVLGGACKLGMNGRGSLNDSAVDERVLEAVALLLGFLGARSPVDPNGMLRDRLHDEAVASLKAIEAEVKAEVSAEKVREFLLDRVKDGAFEMATGADELAKSLVSQEIRSKVRNRIGQTLIWVLEALRAHGLEIHQQPREDSDDLISINWKKPKDEDGHLDFGGKA